VIPPNDEKTSAKILPGANVDFESIDDAARNLPVVVDESYAKERMIDTKTNDVIEPMFTKSEVEEDSFMKKSDLKQLKKEAMKTPFYAEVSKISITDEESKVLKPEVSDKNDENIFKQDIKKEENFNMHTKYDSTCGYQVPIIFFIATILAQIFEFLKCSFNRTVQLERMDLLTFTLWLVRKTKLRNGYM